MINVKSISEITPATSVGGSNKIPGDQNGQTVTFTPDQLCNIGIPASNILTKAQMNALATANLLKLERYIITNATANNINLIVEAIANNKIHTRVQSPEFPQDIIDYDFDTNVIKWRWDTINNISVHQDLRNLSGLTIGALCTNIRLGKAVTGSIGANNHNLIVEAGVVNVGDEHLNPLNQYYGLNGFSSDSIGGLGQPHVWQVMGRNNDPTMLSVQYTANSPGNGGMHCCAIGGIPGFPAPVRKGWPIWSWGFRGFGIENMRGSGANYTIYASEDYTDANGGMWQLWGVTSNGSNVRDSWIALGQDGRFIVGLNAAQVEAMIEDGVSFNDGTGAKMQLASGTANLPPVELTQSQIDDLVPTGKWIVFNLTTGKHQAWNGSIWNNCY